MKNIKEEMLNDYRKLVFECFYYSNISWLIKTKIDIIKNEYKIKITNNYENDLYQFNNFEIENLKNILNILDIESDNEWTNANRCEASALILWEYLRKIN